MIHIGSTVQTKHEVRVHYGKHRPETVIPAGSIGTVKYRPQNEDPAAFHNLGVSWKLPDGSRVGVEVREEEVTLLQLPNGNLTIAGLIAQLQKFDPTKAVMILDGHNGGGVPRTINLKPDLHVVTEEEGNGCTDCEEIVGEEVVVFGYGCY